MRDIEFIYQEQSKSLQLGQHGFGKYSFFVEEMKAAPYRYVQKTLSQINSMILCRFCHFMKRDLWGSDRILDTKLFLRYNSSSLNRFYLSNLSRTGTIPIFCTIFPVILAIMAVLGYDGWIFRKLFETDEENKKLFEKNERHNIFY